MLGDPAAGDPNGATSRIAATWVDRALDGLGSAIVDLDEAADAAAMGRRIAAALRDPDLFAARFIQRAPS